MSRRRKNESYQRIIAVLLLVIVVLGSIAVYYSPFIQGTRAKSLDSVEIYAKSNQSVVTMRGVTVESPVGGSSGSIVSVLGTGFVIAYNNSYYIVTNFHVIDGLVNSTATFSNGDAYVARVVGSDAYSDVAIVSVNATKSEFYPLQLGSSSALSVGETVVAIGNPYGLSDTITVGIVGQLGRTLSTGTSGSYAIADTIQFSAPINPGNSGGPLIDSGGMVVGMTTAVVSDSQGLGFAIPSDTILRELPWLVRDGSYNRHPYFGIQILDMTYEISQVMRTNVTWGVLITMTVTGGPAEKAGLRGSTKIVTIEQQRLLVGGDIIVSLDGAKVVNYDAFAAYLERNVVPGQTVQVGIIRSGSYMVIPVIVGTRPPLT